MLLRLCYVVLWCLLSTVLSAHNAAGATVSQSREFRGLVRQEHAVQAASVAARLSALREVEKSLAAHPDIQFLSQRSGTNPLLFPPLQGLSLLLSRIHLGGQGVGGFPPHLSVVIENDWELVAPLRPQLLILMGDTEYVELYAFAVSRLAHLLVEYDTAAALAMQIHPESLSGQEHVLTVGRLVRAMKGTEQYLELLPRLQKVWQEPAAVLPLLQSALALDPGNALLMVAQAEVYLQLDRPSQAQQWAAEAALLVPSLARAHDVQGTALLRQRLPALAVAAFSEAIQRAPEYAPYYLHRAAANLVQEEIEAMCVDFFAACARSECEGLEWARQTGKCAR